MDTRALIYANLLNGVPEWKVAQDFRVSPEEIRATFRFVSAKIKSYLFERRRPPVFCDSITEAQHNRLKLLPLLERINLNKPPTYSNVQHEHVTSGNVENTFRQLR